MKTLPEPNGESLPPADILPPNPIRVETGLSRYPIHRLAKHGDIAINIREKNENGEVSIKWEVTHNSKYGQPGPLAYKFDTLIVNRRIEEAARPIPKLIRLGGLTEICRELGQANSGKNTNHLKNALRQNAFAAITAKIRYRQNDGRERTLEADFTRYSVIFTGEELPDGRRADAVYIVLNDIYMQVINGAQTRPLDYDYLKSLTPAAQRFYEILSYRMYAAIKNDRPRAKLHYSELCTYAPLTRQTDWNVVRPQLARIHAPHKASGYIARIDYEQIADSDGQPDWIMHYQPGPRARAEYRSFTKRGGPVILQAEPFRDSPPTLDALQQPALPLAEPEPSPLEAALTGYGIAPAKAAELTRQHDAADIALKIEYLEYEQAKKPGKIADPAAWLYTAIRDGRGKPRGFISREERQRREEERRAKERAAADERRRKQEEEARDKAERQAIAAYWDSLTPEQQKELQAQADAKADPADLARETGVLKRIGQQIRRSEHIRDQLRSRQPQAENG